MSVFLFGSAGFNWGFDKTFNESTTHVLKLYSFTKISNVIVQVTNY